MKNLSRALLAATVILAIGPVRAIPVASSSCGSQSKKLKPRPKIASMTPDSYEVPTPNFTGHPDPDFVTMLISGQNFGSKSVALWNGRGLATHFLSATEIEATVPFKWIEELTGHGSNPDDWHGSASVVVRYAGVGSAKSSAAKFKVTTLVMGG